MKYLYSLILLSFSIFSFSQDLSKATITFDSIQIKNFSGLQSCALAEYNDYFIAFGGRTEGIHAINPAEAFPKLFNNDSIILLKRESDHVLKSSLLDLDISLRLQLQSTNMLAIQDDDKMLIVGGYAENFQTEQFETYPYLTIVDLPLLIKNIEKGLSIKPAFQQIKDDRFRITGGEMEILGDEFLMVGGMDFSGVYNGFDMPSFEQKYTNQIQIFKVDSYNPASITFTDTYFDSLAFHRRDYNLLQHINTEGEEELMISSGVFTYVEKLPWHHPVFISRESHYIDTTFNQLLSNYHSAKVSFYSKQHKKMSHLFFGGIARYYFDGDQLVKDDEVPFVKTISLVEQDSLGKLLEYKIENDMPGYLGAVGHFIPNKTLKFHVGKIIDIDALATEKILIGYIVGGIRSHSKHPFFNKKHLTTSPNNIVYKVYLEL